MQERAHLALLHQDLSVRILNQHAHHVDVAHGHAVLHHQSGLALHHLPEQAASTQKGRVPTVLDPTSANTDIVLQIPIRFASNKYCVE